MGRNSSTNISSDIIAFIKHEEHVANFHKIYVVTCKAIILLYGENIILCNYIGVDARILSRHI